MRNPPKTPNGNTIQLKQKKISDMHSPKPVNFHNLNNGNAICGIIWLTNGLTTQPYYVTAPTAECGELAFGYVRKPREEISEKKESENIEGKKEDDKNLYSFTNIAELKPVTIKKT